MDAIDERIPAKVKKSDAGFDKHKLGKHFQGFNYIETSPRTRYARKKQIREELALKLLTNLDSARMAAIKEEFRQMEDSVNMVEFVAIMEAHLPDYVYAGNTASGENGNYLDRHGIIANLVELFQEVDINGDGMMEWEEFTRFIVEKAQLYHQLQAVEDLPSYRHASRSVEEISRHRHGNTIEKICFMRRHHKKSSFSEARSSHRAGNTTPEKLAVLEQQHTFIAIYNARSWSLLEQLKHKAVPLSMTYIEDYNLLAVCCADMNMVLWNMDEGPPTRHYTQLARWPALHAQMSMVWCRAHQLLYSGSTTGEICAWDLRMDQEKGVHFDPVLVREKCLEGHTDIVMDLIIMESMNSLVSASLDSTIQIWDTFTGKLFQKLVGHKKGVFALSYSEKYRCLVSAGFDHEAYVWSPFVSSKLTKLKGHHASLVGCQCIAESNEIITADASGIFKVWDLRSFVCRATFTSDHEPGDVSDLNGLSTFCHMSLPPIKTNQKKDDFRLVAATRRLIYFDQYRQRNEPVTDDQPITCTCFNSTSLTILTASERNVKIWDAVIGNLKHVFKNITQSEITAVCLDDRDRKFVVGDATGNVAIHNYQNGALIKTLPSFTLPKPVVSLKYCKGKRAVLVACASKQIKVLDDSDPERCILLQEFHESPAMQHKKEEDLNCLAYNSYARLVATGTAYASDGSDGVIIWDFDLGKGVLLLSVKGNDTVTILTLEFLGTYPLLLVTSSDGMMRLWGVDCSKYKGSCVLTLQNEKLKEDMLDESVFQNVSELATLGGPYVPSVISVDGPGEVKRSSVVSVAFDPVAECVYSGDESGSLKKWDFRSFLGHLQETRFNSPRSMPGGMRSAVMRKTYSRMLSHNQRTEDLPTDPVGVVWGLNAAHDGSIDQVVVLQQASSVLTISLDRTLKIWSFHGECMGTLLQGLPPNSHSPSWDLRVDVEKREQQEAEYIDGIMEQVNAQGVEQTPDEGAGNHSIKSPSLARSGSSPLGYGKAHSSAVTFMELDHSLSQSSQKSNKSHHVDRRSRNPFHRKMQNSKLLLKSLEKENRNLKPSQANKLSSSLPNLEGIHSGRFNWDNMSHRSSYSSLSSADLIGDAKSLGGRSQRKKLPTIVPPSPGRKKEIKQEIVTKMERLQNMLDNWEAFQGDQKFQGKSQHLKEFIQNVPPTTQQSDEKMNGVPSELKQLNQIHLTEKRETLKKMKSLKK